MENNSRKSWDDAQTQRDALDGALDAALAHYSAVEPRPGLEQRTLAHLRSERDRISTRSWWQWSAFATVAALLAIAATFAWRSSRQTKTVAQHPSAPIQAVDSSPMRKVTNNQTNDRRPFAVQANKATPRHTHQPIVVADEPKLDQFPSARPLSEQERLALEYVARFPEEASLIAQAQTNLARQQEIEEKQERTNPQ